MSRSISRRFTRLSNSASSARSAVVSAPAGPWPTSTAARLTHSRSAVTGEVELLRHLPDRLASRRAETNGVGLELRGELPSLALCHRSLPRALARFRECLRIRGISIRPRRYGPLTLPDLLSHSRQPRPALWPRYRQRNRMASVEPETTTANRLNGLARATQFSAQMRNMNSKQVVGEPFV